ncbi:MAG TPA: rhodanese-like domain-containing protein [Tepidisphaeraceae bacterium]|nr:rhodanese-like domain-containing protein [Tepidisphaeraceae bacterium]
MKSTTVSQLIPLAKNGTPLRLLDVRSPAEFSSVHAAGACLIPLDELSPSSIASAGLKSDETVYVLCQSGGRAAIACERLASMGINNAVRVEGGTIAWEKASLPVIRGTQGGISIERQVRIAAGAVMLIGLLLAWLVHPAFVALSTFVGAGLIFSGITNYCGLGLMLAKLPFNRRAKPLSAAKPVRAAT